jgi:8-oxo-dGTP diphosphatase
MLASRQEALLIRRRDNQRWEPLAASSNSAKSSMADCDAKSLKRPDFDIEPIALSGVYKNITRTSVNLAFRCKITGGGLVANDEASDFR